MFFKILIYSFFFLAKNPTNKNLSVLINRELVEKEDLNNALTKKVQQGDNRVVKTNFGLTLQGYLVPDSINKELVKKPQKYFSKSVITFQPEIISSPSGIAQTREEVRDVPQNLGQIGTGVGFQIVEFTNVIA